MPLPPPRESAKKAYGMLLEEEEKPTAAPSPSADRKLLATQSWRRLVMAVMLLISTTRQQMVLDYMQQKATEADEEKVNVRDTKNKTKSKKDKGAWIDQGIGVPMSRSTARKHWEKEPKECNRPCSGVPSMPSKSLQPVMGLPDMRKPMGEVAAGPSGLIDDYPGSRDTRCSTPSNESRNLSGALAGSKAQTGPRQYPVGSGQARTTNQCTSDDNVNHLVGSSDHSDQRDRDSGVGPGREQLGSSDRDGGSNQPQLATAGRGCGQRLLVGPDLVARMARA